MMLHAALIALALQATPAAPQAARASVAGVVVNAGGEPIPNVRVSLGKMNVNLGPFAQMVAGERPPAEMTLPADFFALMTEQIGIELATGNVPPEEAATVAALKSVPLADIHEIIVGPTGGIVVIPKSTPPVMTDERGRFAFDNVEPGTYRLMFSGNGYAKQDYGQRASAGGIPINLSAGQSRTDIVMRLVKVAAVSGNIRDVRGAPAAGVPVHLSRFVYDENGQRQTFWVTSTRTDDRGEYRMYYLTPGRYYLSAGHLPGEEASGRPMVPTEALLLGAGSSTANRIAQSYALAYYPGVLDENAASPIDVQPGADVRGIDLSVNPQQAYRIRGRVVDSRTGQPPQAVSLSINVQNPASGGTFISSGSSQNYRQADGTFEMQNINPGKYTISASLPSAPTQRPPNLAEMSPEERNAYFQATQAADLARSRASTTVHVVNGDVNDVILSLDVSSSIPGRLRVESNTSIADSLGFMRVQLRSAAAPDPLAGVPGSRTIAPDGTFRLDNVWPGEYRVATSGMPPGFYLKEVRLGDEDVLNQHLRLTGPDSRFLDVLISSRVGAIDGTAVDGAGRPMPGAQVVLIPNRNRARTELFRPVTADLSGRFTLADVAPGEYTLAAWEAIEPNAFFDPNLIQQAEANGKAVRVAEGSTQTVTVTSIPAGQ